MKKDNSNASYHIINGRVYKNEHEVTIYICIDTTNIAMKLSTRIFANSELM